MFDSLRSAARRRAVLLASGTAVVLAVGGGTTAAFAASGDSTPAPSASASCRPHLRAMLRGAEPAALQADLKTLRSEPKADRAAERKLIRQKALSGAYGARIERIAQLVGGNRAHLAAVRGAYPAALKADLKTLRATAPKSTARKAQVQRIEQKALAGDYGTAIQQRAKAVQARLQQRCAAK